VNEQATRYCERNHVHYPFDGEIWAFNAWPKPLSLFISIKQYRVFLDGAVYDAADFVRYGGLESIPAGACRSVAWMHTAGGPRRAATPAQRGGTGAQRGAQGCGQGGRQHQGATREPRGTRASTKRRSRQ
jgi:hypothetical protein